ncbi:MAG: exodeoxyribonuclease small subunit [Chthoniobacter sp.]|jgi:exodeoxyribonuclease VII small subunit|nr:exodeoxyribonuclease small subunit [Chthoniobacter sp.]
MAKPPADAPAPPPTFETALTRLEQLVEEMDSRDLPLQDLITRYEEGVQLVKVCEDRLKDAEKRIEIITRGAGGKPELTEFEPETKTASQPREDVSLF